MKGCRHLSYGAHGAQLICGMRFEQAVFLHRELERQKTKGCAQGYEMKWPRRVCLHPSMAGDGTAKVSKV